MVVVTATRCESVVDVVLAVVVDIVVLVTELTLLGSRTTWLLPVLLPGSCTIGTTWDGAAALDDVTVASVAMAVASTTPEPARMTLTLDFQRLSPGDTVSSGSIGSGTVLSLVTRVTRSGTGEVCTIRC